MTHEYKFNIGDTVIITEATKVGMPGNSTGRIDGCEAKIINRHYQQSRGVYYFVKTKQFGCWWVYEAQCRLKYELQQPAIGDTAILGI